MMRGFAARRAGAWVVCAVLSLLSVAAPAFGEPPAHGKRVVGYFAEWGNPFGFDVSKIPADKLTHINYAFALVGGDGRIKFADPVAATQKAYPGDADAAGGAPAFRGHFRQLQLLKRKHPHLKTLVSVGGWTGSAGFYDMAKTAETRERFARSAAEFVRTYDFDGLDIDWEYPGGGGNDKGKGGPEDTKNFTLLMQELRKHLDEKPSSRGERLLLTAATAAGPRAWKNIEMDKVHPLLDFFNVMTYDFAGTWNERTGFNAPLYAWEGQPAMSGDDAVKGYLAAGVPAEKISLGVPFYGRAFGGVKNEKDGLNQPHDKTDPKPPGPGHWSYRNIAESYLAKGPTRFWHDGAKVPWLYDAGKQVMVTYDDAESLKLKAKYVRDHNLGGIMIWELSEDDAKGTLIGAVDEGLTGR